MEKERAAIAAKFPHVVCVPYLGHARELGKMENQDGFGAISFAVSRLRKFLAPFAGIAPCLYFDPGDEGTLAEPASVQSLMMRIWRKIAPKKPLYPVVWHYNKVARRICTPAEWKCQLDACVGPNVKGVVWWGEANGNDNSGRDSDPATLARFVRETIGTGGTP